MRLTLGQQIIHYQQQRNSNNSQLLCDRIISRGIIHLIQRQPFYGILLAKIDRINNQRLQSPFSLGWYQHKIKLEYNPDVFAEWINTERDLLFWLEHEALHLIWLHPVRYPRANELTQMATDIAVNQLIPIKVQNQVTLEQINRSWGLSLIPNMNSKVYLNQLKQFLDKQQGKSKDKRLVNRKIKHVLKRKSDDHRFWGSESQVSRQAKTVQLKRLIKRSYQNTGAKARGTLPGRVHEQLQKLNVHSSINWRAYVKMGLGSVPFGRKTSRARFNRRQAYRMDLMGTVSNYIQPVQIFVDNSGSMGDQEISFLLAQLGDFLKHMPVNVGVYDFDTEVHVLEHYHANNYHQLKFTRVGGGGTCFQCIFNYCHQHLNTNRNQLIIILTDGFGEDHLRYYGFDNLLWILTEPKTKFSVKNVRGQLISLVNDPILRANRGL
ncbi:DUF2201 family putative metallopeptidase [Acetilactobacillus jinshanensis]|uniref:VWA domain-containing protein n=1 Tax=Acetilactobacillus jinshanensis TaxID=1720083 RepID=A0A4V1ALS4_9LACO|nr:VWA-like domain-containing protein [Acetilactobacillus jinshanensis]QBP18609.1 VWA domain-containing protein [Acetilactobacillus jinshanensis]URL61485.1 VWA domain-containing protein [uncultured bacterium]